MCSNSPRTYSSGADTCVCPYETYVSSDTCMRIGFCFKFVVCPAKCDICISNLECVQCKPGMRKLVSPPKPEECFLDCPDGTDTYVSNECRDCAVLCKKCTDANSNGCTSCLETWPGVAPVENGQCHCKDKFFFNATMGAPNYCQSMDLGTSPFGRVR
jgi:hypothetical protein